MATGSIRYKYNASRRSLCQSVRPKDGPMKTSTLAVQDKTKRCPNVHSARVYVPRMGPSLSMHSRGNNLLPLGFCLLLLKSSTRFVKIDERAKYTVNFKSRDSVALPETYGASPGVQATCFDVEFRDSCGRRARSK